MITIKGKDEASLVARIEKELKGEEVDIFQSDDVDYSMEQVLGFLGYNAKQTRVYIGRLERNSRKLEEDVRQLNELVLPISMFFGKLIEDMYPTQMLPRDVAARKARIERLEFLNKDRTKHEGSLSYSKESLAKSFETQKRIADELKAAGKTPEKE